MHTEETKRKISAAMRQLRAEGRCIGSTAHLAEWRQSQRCRDVLREQGKKHGAANGRAQALPRDLAAGRIRFRHYVSRAAERGIAWALSFEEFAGLIASSCWYCGAAPKQTITRFRDQPHNGIDRVDNAVGYEIENVVPCCGDCNSAKSTMSQSDFLRLVKLIAERHR